MGNKLIIYGAGDTGMQLAHEVNAGKKLRDYQFQGFVDDFKPDSIISFNGFMLWGNSAVLPLLFKKGFNNIVVSLVKNLQDRLEKFSELEKLGFSFPSIVPAGLPKNLRIGKGVYIHDSSEFIGDNQVIEDYAVIGPFALIEGSSYIGKGSILRPYSFLGSHSSLGEASEIGLRSSVLPEVRIGNNCLIGPHVLQHKNLNHGQKNLRHY